jgi:hypothetical protein
MAAKKAKTAILPPPPAAGEGHTGHLMRVDSTDLRASRGGGGETNAYMQVTERVREGCRKDLLSDLFINADLATLKGYVLGIKQTLVKVLGNDPRFDIIDKVAEGDDYIAMYGIIFFALWKHISVMHYFVPPPETGMAPKVPPKQMQDFRAKILPNRLKDLLRGTGGQHLEKTVSDLLAEWTSLAVPERRKQRGGEGFVPPFGE